MQASRRRCASSSAALALVLAPAAAAHSQSVEEFYRGKTINMIIGYPAAGANDHYARTVARHIGKHIPGQPKVIARNMPGGGSTGVPADRFKALRRAFDATIKDPEYIAEMNQQKLEITPLSGEEMQKLVAQVAAISPAILNRVKAIYPLN